MPAEWLYERGIGEARAALVADGAIIEAHVERDDSGLRLGAIVEARLGAREPGGRAEVRLPDGARGWLRPVPSGLGEGSSLLVEVTRTAIPEPGNPKPPFVRPAPPAASPDAGPDLLARIAHTGIAIRPLRAHEPDALEAAGWSELLDAAATGLLAFPGGLLRLSLTPAMTLLDVDGHLPPDALAVAGAGAAGAAIRRLGITGSIGIDLPGASGKAVRQAAADAFDAALPPPFERTAVNGFGFLQIVRRRAAPSLPELIQADPVAAAALALLRRAERSVGAGRRTLVAAAPVVRLLEARRDWIAELARRTGVPIGLRAGAGPAISAAYVESEHP